MRRSSALITCLTVASACGPVRRAESIGGVGTAFGATRLVIENGADERVVVYLLRGEGHIRLGALEPMERGAFRVERRQLGGGLELQALGVTWPSGRRIVSNAVAVDGGETVSWKIAPGRTQWALRVSR